MTPQRDVSIDQLLDLFAEVFQEPRNKISPDRQIESLDGWDSVGVLTLMAELDDHFGVALSTEEIQKIKVLSDIITLLSAKNIEIT